MGTESTPTIEELERYRLMERIASTTADLMSFVDRTFTYRAVNEAYLKVHGRPRAEFVGRTVAEVMGEAVFAEVIRPELARCFAGEEVHYQAPFDFAEGRRHVDVRYSPFRDGGEVVGAVVVVRDITELHRAQERNRQAAQVFSSTVEGVTITDLEGTILDVNPAFTEITGYAREEALGENPRILKSGRHDDAYYERMWRALRDDGSWRGEIWNRRKSGEVYPEVLTISTVQDEQGAPSGYVAVFSDITTSKRNQEHLEFLAHHDALTQLPNRLLLGARLDQSIDSARRAGGKLALMFIDIDRFKRINDTLGHHAGDELLIQISQRLQRIVRAEDTVARVSGDEFVILCQNIGDADRAEIIAKKILSAFGKHFLLDGHEVDMSCSVGVALFPDDGADAASLVRAADSAMYLAKDEGRATFRFVSRDASDGAEDYLLIERELPRAIAEQHFRVEYQTQVRLRDEAVVGVEALARWHHPELGSIAPSRFVPVASQSGQMVALGEHFFRSAFAQAARWIREGRHFGVLALNAHRVELRRAELADALAEALRESEIDPARVELEIGEATFGAPGNRALATLERVLELGVGIVVDDVGSGVTSLGALARLPVKKLKIARSLVARLPHEADAVRLAEMVRSLGTAVRCPVVAVGVETEGQLELLRQLGVELVQGYLFSRPRPAEAVELPR